MVKLNGQKKDGNVILPVGDFEHLLNCLANQKFIGEPPACGDAMAAGPEGRAKVDAENQKAIDDAWKQGMDLLHESMNKLFNEHIVRLSSGKFRLLSHKGKNLGTFDSHRAAAKHEGEVEYFKAHSESFEIPSFAQFRARS